MINIKEIIEEAKANSYTQAIPIENFTMNDLKELSEATWMEDISIRMKPEHSNFHQGVMVEVQRNWDTVEQEIKDKLKDEIKDIIKSATRLENGFKTLGL